MYTAHLKCFAFILLCVRIQTSYAQTIRPIEPIPFTAVKINDKFWSSKIKAHMQGTLPACIAEVDDEKYRIANFQRVAGLKSGKFEGIFFDDSDVYKAIEAAAYTLQNTSDPQLEKKMDGWIELIVKAQHPDGYLNTYYTLRRNKSDGRPQLDRWTDMGRHEMYCGGHMIEAAVAYYRATGKRKLLDVAIRFADHCISIFGPGEAHWVPGHQEIELALVKLYQVTNEKKYLGFAHWLLEQRGHGYEAGPIIDSFPKRSDALAYFQSDVPVKDIDNIKGHAVRAMYMFTGMADVMTNTFDTTYIAALRRVWEDVVFRNMYITGGIGNSRTNEGFVEDYYLPNKTSYCETCASIGMVFWNNRMNALTAESKYADVMEKVMYNAVLGGVSLSGDRFFYDNPHESDGDFHRQKWWSCACCPVNIARFIPSVGNYFYLQKDNELFINIYAGNEMKTTIGQTSFIITQKTLFPWDGKIVLSINPESPVKADIKMRIPGWCTSYTLQLNGKRIKSEINNGYVSIDREWNKDDVITLNLDMPVKMITDDPRVKDNIGKLAIQRGPVVYCAEQADNPGTDLNKLFLGRGNKFKIADITDGPLQGMKKLETISGKKKITLIPYHAWDNREAGKMLVWINNQMSDK